MVTHAYKLIKDCEVQSHYDFGFGGYMHYVHFNTTIPIDKIYSEEAYIDELEKKLLDYEAKYRFLNFAEIREHPELYPEHAEYTNTLKTIRDRGTFLISNYAIYSPYFNEYSKIFNFDYMRKNIEAKEYPLEEYIVMSLRLFEYMMAILNDKYTDKQLEYLHRVIN